VGVGDMLAQPCTHSLASGMGGIRTAGDLVARMQVTRGMRLKAAKAYVADKLGVGADDLSDPTVMGDVRRELGLARQISPESTFPTEPNGIEAKFNIERVLDVPVNCVQRFAERVPSVGAAWKRGGGVA
jgi:dimethylamine--corrinoid protein Co-methyltransferase